MITVTEPNVCSRSIKLRLYKHATRKVLKHYESLSEPFFILDLQQIAKIITNGFGMRGAPFRDFPVYVPVTLSLLWELEARAGKIIKFPTVRVKYKSILLVLSQNTVSAPLRSIDDCVALLGESHIVNLINIEETLPVAELLQKMFRLYAQVYSLNQSNTGVGIHKSGGLHRSATRKTN